MSSVSSRLSFDLSFERSRARDDDNSNVMCASPEVGGGTRTR
jgi:hypothetical protein